LDVKVRKSKGGGRQRKTREGDYEDRAEPEAIEILNENQAELIPRSVKKVVDQRVLKAVEDPESKQTEGDLNFIDVEMDGLGEISGIPIDNNGVFSFSTHQLLEQAPSASGADPARPDPDARQSHHSHSSFMGLVGRRPRGTNARE